MLVGIATVVNPVEENAYDSITVTLVGIVTDVRDEQY